MIYISPMIINYLQVGSLLTGNKYQTEIAYIQNLQDVVNHLIRNIASYLNIFSTNFWFL